MDIILLKNIEKVGRKFEIVSVKAGFGRNYLIPQGLAIIANKNNRSNLESFKRQETAKLNKKLDSFKDIAAQLKDKVVIITTKTGSNGKIFGSVTNIQLAQMLNEQLGIEVDRRDILLPEDHIKMIGRYTAQIDLHPDVDAKIHFEVLSDDTEVNTRVKAAQEAEAAEAAAATAEA